MQALSLEYGNNPALETFLKLNLGSKLDQLDYHQTVKLKQYLVRALCQVDSHQKYAARVKKICPPLSRELTDLRRRMVETYELNSCYKLAVLWEIQGRRKFERYGFAGSTCMEFDDLLTDKLRDKLAAKTSDIMIEKPSVRHLNKLLLDVILETKGWTARFAHAKLSFIASSNRYQVQDLISDLQAKAIETGRWVYPFRTEEHLLNSCKRAIHNAGINLIYHYNSDKRARLVPVEGGGFENVHRLSFDNEDTSDTFAKDFSVEDSIAYSQLASKYRDCEASTKVFHILTGHEQTLQSFLYWINGKLDQAFDDPFKAMHRLGSKEFCRNLSIFSGLPADKLNSIMMEVKDELHSPV